MKKKYPDKYKLSKIIPQVKQGKDPLSTSSYRPISNLCTIGKLIETAFFDQVQLFKKNNIQTNPNQHGGRQGHSTTTCVVELLSSINKGIEDNKKVALLSIDLSAAYDLCDHSVLIQKFRIMKMGEDAVSWLTSFLSDRSQYVELNGSKSSPIQMKAKGAIQGGKSSGELFTIYIDDLPAQINNNKPETEKDDSNAQEFVDDVNVVVKAATEEELKIKLNLEYQALSRYLINHHMLVYEEKTQIMLINPQKS